MPQLSEVFEQEIDPVMKKLGYCCGRKVKCLSKLLLTCGYFLTSLWPPYFLRIFHAYGLLSVYISSSSAVLLWEALVYNCKRCYLLDLSKSVCVFFSVIPCTTLAQNFLLSLSLLLSLLFYHHHHCNRLHVLIWARAVIKDWGLGISPLYFEVFTWLHVDLTFVYPDLPHKLMTALLELLV